jgi:hypothetical protein
MSDHDPELHGINDMPAMNEMHEGDKLDLTALDPTQDSARWARLVQTVSERAIAHRARLTVSRQLLVWAQPTLALAAAVSLMIWAGALLGARDETHDPVDQLSQWAAGDEMPSTTNIFETFGVAHGSR